MSLKEARLENLSEYSDSGLFQLVKMDLADRESIANLFSDEKFDRVIH